MPQSKEVHKEYMRKRREGSQKDETVPASYVQGITGKFLSLPERPRYLTLSDRQVLDRWSQPESLASGDFIHCMQACNESAYNFKPNMPSKERMKVLEKL